MGRSSGELQQGVLEREMRANFHIKANDALGFTAFDVSYMVFFILPAVLKVCENIAMKVPVSTLGLLSL